MCAMVHRDEDELQGCLILSHTLLLLFLLLLSLHLHLSVHRMPAPTHEVLCNYEIVLISLSFGILKGFKCHDETQYVRLCTA